MTALALLRLTAGQRCAQPRSGFDVDAPVEADIGLNGRCITSGRNVNPSTHMSDCGVPN